MIIPNEASNNEKTTEADQGQQGHLSPDTAENNQQEKRQSGLCGKSKGFSAQQDIDRKLQEFFPRWNREFSERMRSIQVSAAFLFQEGFSRVKGGAA